MLWMGQIPTHFRMGPLPAMLYYGLYRGGTMYSQPQIAFCAGYDVTAEFKGGASVPIGRPINNMRCYVLDPQLQLLPVGMAGELMVSGIQLAREYLDNPEKTAASFIQNPHNHDNHPNHTRVYRTGTQSIAGRTAFHPKSVRTLPITFDLSEASYSCMVAIQESTLRL